MSPGQMVPDDFRYWESPQTLPALFIGPFEHVKRFRNLKFAVKRITNIQSTVLSSSEGTTAIHLAFKQRTFNKQQIIILLLKWAAKVLH